MQAFQEELFKRHLFLLYSCGIFKDDDPNELTKISDLGKYIFWFKHTYHLLCLRQVDDGYRNSQWYNINRWRENSATQLYLFWKRHNKMLTIDGPNGWGDARNNIAAINMFKYPGLVISRKLRVFSEGLGRPRHQRSGGKWKACWKTREAERPLSLKKGKQVFPQTSEQGSWQ